MRINLKVPFAQKEAAKELGARWDAARKIWYVVDPECLEVFSDWMPEQESPSATAGAIRPASQALSSPGVLTGPQRVSVMCACAVQPWDACPHSPKL